ncbi:MAG: hypothetical protein RL456_3239, partial [Pseudomonadota bacterium]
MAHVTISPAARRILDAIAGFAADDAIVERTLTASGDNVGRATVTLAEAAIASMAKAPTSRTDAQRALTSAAGNAKSLALAIASAAACELPNPAALR